MLSEDDRRFLESGCALIVGTVAADGTPHASRGWGLDVLDDRGVRLVLDGDDAQTIANADATGAIAITAADVRTLHSVQLKGSVRAIQQGGEAEVARALRYADAFFGDIHDTDGTAYHVLERLVPSRYVVCECQVDDWFDQTPGPGAGGPVERIAPTTEAT